jgi:hypothetical protein
MIPSQSAYQMAKRQYSSKAAGVEKQTEPVASANLGIKISLMTSLLVASELFQVQILTRRVSWALREYLGMVRR